MTTTQLELWRNWLTPAKGRTQEEWRINLALAKKGQATKRNFSKRSKRP